MKRYSRVHAEIDLDAILHNMEAMHQCVSRHTRLMAVIKADGYGHGAVEIAEAIDGLPYVFGYAVATVEEGLILRNHGIEKPILILGYVFPEQYHDMIRARIRPTVFTSDMAERLSVMAGRLEVECPIHFAVDTGMSRIGYQATEEAAEEMARIASLPHIVVEGIFTHFARADEADKTSTYRQLDLFRQMIRMLKERGVTIPIHHCANSAAIVDLPETNMDLVRAGITMYGLWPSPEVDKSRDRSKTGALSCHTCCLCQGASGRTRDQLRRDLYHVKETEDRDDPRGLCRRLCKRTFQSGGCADPREESADLRQGLYGSVYGGCHGHPADGDGR